MNEINGINAVYEGNKEKALIAGGECAPRIDDTPTVRELVDDIMKEAEEIIGSLSKRFLVT